MDIVLSDEYRTIFSGIVDESETTQTVKQPDRRSHDELGNRVYEQFVKRFRQDDGFSYYVWVLCSVDGHTYTVCNALVIPTSLGDSIDSMTPLEMLGPFLEKFGLVIKSKHKSSKFIQHETFWTPEKPTPPWTLKDPKEGGTILGWNKVEPRGSSYRVDSHFVFAIDMQEYTGWLQRNGYKAPQPG